MTRREISGLLVGMASRRSGYAAAPGAPQVRPELSSREISTIEKSLKKRFGPNAPKVMKA